MENMRAVVVRGHSPTRIVLEVVAAPIPTPSEAIVRVAATSLNLGEVRGSRSSQDGARPGWDLAGTVEHSALDGSGPTEGTRVVGLLPSGSWAEFVAVPTHSLAVLPPEVSFSDAATLPVAGLTALYCLEHAGSLLGQSVLITGASGGVGHIACSIARHAGAKVIASVRSPERADLVRELGVHEVIIGEEINAAKDFGPYDLILESIGGRVLAQALTMVASDGACVTYGVSQAGESTIRVRDFFRTGGVSLYGFILFHEIKRRQAAQGLQRLVQLVSDDVLQPWVTVEAPLEEIGMIADRLYNREIVGKAVIHFQ